VTPTDVSVTKAKLADEVDIFAGTSLSAADLGAGVHIKTGDSGGSVTSTADELVVEGSGDMGIQLMGGASSSCGIAFGDSGDSNVGLITYNHANNSMSMKTNDTVHMTIDSTGAMTKPLQPAFLAQCSGTQTYGSNNNTNIVVSFATERFDQNADFNNSTYIFTAPVTGKYQLSYSIYLYDVDTDMNYIQIEINASNRTVYNAHSTGGFDATVDYKSMQQTILMDMDANDTAKINLKFIAGSDLRADSSSFFSGVLVC